MLTLTIYQYNKVNFSSRLIIKVRGRNIIFRSSNKSSNNLRNFNNGILIPSIIVIIMMMMMIMCLVNKCNNRNKFKNKLNLLSLLTKIVDDPIFV